MTAIYNLSDVPTEDILFEAQARNLISTGMDEFTDVEIESTAKTRGIIKPPRDVSQVLREDYSDDVLSTELDRRGVLAKIREEWEKEEDHRLRDSLNTSSAEDIMAEIEKRSSLGEAMRFPRYVTKEEAAWMKLRLSSGQFSDILYMIENIIPELAGLEKRYLDNLKNLTGENE